MPDFESPPDTEDSQHPLSPLPSTGTTRLPTKDPSLVRQFFLHDPVTGQVTCRVLPSGPGKMADTTLLLLLGHQELLGSPTTSALVLNEALRRSGGTVARLDRVLARHLREQWILKSGKGKGGKYRLSRLGEQQAWDTLTHLVSLLPAPSP